MKFDPRIPQILCSLGVRNDTRLVLSSICSVIIVFFYFFVVGSAFQIKIYTFLHRITYEKIFAAHIATLDIDILILLLATIAWCYLSLKNRFGKFAIIAFYSSLLVMLFLNLTSAALLGAALSLPFVIVLIILDKLRNKSILNNDVKLSIIYIAVALIGLAASGIISLLVFLLTGATNVTTDKYPYSLFQELPAILTPLMMAVLVFCIPIKVILNQPLKKLKFTEDVVARDIPPEHLSTKWIIVCLSVSIMLGITITVIPHLLIVNPNSAQLGVDSAFYSESINMIKNQTSNPIYFAFKDISPADRVLTVVILYLITESMNADAFQVVEFSPLILAPLLVIVTFFLTRELTSNDKISIISSFLAVISFQILIGIYSGYYANWLALILGYSAFVLIVMCLRRLDQFKLIGLALLMIGVLFSHTYTWAVIMSVAYVFLFVLHALRYFPKKNFLLLYLVLSSSIVVDVVKSLWVGSPTGLELDLSIGSRYGLGIMQFGERLKTLDETVQTYYGGAYANIGFLGLAVYWLVRCKIRELTNIFLLIFMSTALIPLFIGDWVLQSRVLYNFPFQIPAAISLYTIWKENHKLIFIAMLLITSYLSFHVLANLGFVLPS